MISPFLKKAFGKKVLATFHQPVDSFVDRIHFWRKKMLDKIDQIIVVSTTQQSILSRFLKKSVDYIPIGVEFDNPVSFVNSLYCFGRSFNACNISITPSWLSILPNCFVFSGEEEKLGAKVQELTPQLAARYRISGIKQGVIVLSVEDGSIADEIGLQEGDVILEINRKKIENLKDFEKAISAFRNLLTYSRESQFAPEALWRIGRIYYWKRIGIRASDERYCIFQSGKEKTFTGCMF
jgi:membrane-associated protease RseP (regulator of RpoE activity)